jgi:hypothetical protein
MPKITFTIVPDAAFPDCEPVRALEVLAAAGALRRFMRKYGKRSGDCHEMAHALVMDLADCRDNVPFKWFWYTGNCPRIGEHSWVECEGWAIDASNGADRPIVIVRATEYRRMIQATNIAQAIDKPSRRSSGT